MVALGGLGIFAGFFLVIWLAGLLSVGLGIAALISVARTPIEAFGPWWDNTRQLWLIGIAVSFLVPVGNLIAGILWFTTGRSPLRNGQGYVGRPFWAGPPKPPPPPGWPGAPGYPPSYGYGAPPPPPPGWQQQPPPTTPPSSDQPPPPST